MIEVNEIINKMALQNTHLLRRAANPIAGRLFIYALR